MKNLFYWQPAAPRIWPSTKRGEHGIVSVEDNPNTGNNTFPFTQSLTVAILRKVSKNYKTEITLRPRVIKLLLLQFTFVPDTTEEKVQEKPDAR